MKRYVKHKDELLSCYNRILSEHNLVSVKILIETLISMEKRHKRNILKNRLLQNLDGLLEFPHMLSSTPISEYGALSKVLKHIILFRGKSLISNFADLANISKPNIEKHLEKIKDIERNLQTRLRAVKSECNL